MAKSVVGTGALALLSVVLILAIMSKTEVASPPPQALRAACMSDAHGLCAAVIDNLQARRACMTEDSAELSASCKAAIANGAAERQASPMPAKAQTGCQDAINTSRVILFQRAQPGRLTPGQLL